MYESGEYALIDTALASESFRYPLRCDKFPDPPIYAVIDGSSFHIDYSPVFILKSYKVLSLKIF